MIPIVKGFKINLEESIGMVLPSKNGLTVIFNEAVPEDVIYEIFGNVSGLILEKENFPHKDFIKKFEIRGWALAPHND